MSREIVEKALGPAMTARIWTGRYNPVLGFTPQDFSIGALLPAMMYMFRWGNRRGKGGFLKNYSDEQLIIENPKKNTKPFATIRSIVNQFSADPLFFRFDGKPEKVILGDLFLSSVIENANRSPLHAAHVARCFARHYFSSWVDLPSDVGNLRGIPELIVAIIYNQKNGGTIEPFIEGGNYPVGCRISDNKLLSAFASGTEVQGDFKSFRRSDSFNEKTNLGIDQILTIRLGQKCDYAPDKASGKKNQAPIPNTKPIAGRAAAQFRKDFIAFFEAYNETIPRSALISMLETCFSLGLSTIVLSTISIVENWQEKGYISLEKDQRPLPIFVDCSASEDKNLRDLSEQSGDLVRERLGRVPNYLMYMRLLDEFVHRESDLKPAELPSPAPEGKAWLDLLGAIATGVHAESANAERSFRRYCRELLDSLDENDQDSIYKDFLTQNSMKAGVILSETLVRFMNYSILQSDMLTMLNSCLLVDQPNGFSRSRRVKFLQPRRGRKSGDVYSFTFSNISLEYLVHRHVRSDGKDHKFLSLSFPKFLDVLHELYGICIDKAPQNMEIPSELLQLNRRILERRLRDLGLLVGVNDAERMKRLRQRYPSNLDAQGRHEEGGRT